MTGLTRDYIDAPARLLHLLRHAGHTALFYVDEGTTEEQYRSLAALADEIRRRFGGAVACHGIAAPGAKLLHLERFQWALDAAGSFRAAFGAVGGSIELLRPDGHIGQRGTVTNVGGLLAALDRIVVK